MSRGISDKVLSEFRKKESREAKQLLQQALEVWSSALAEAKTRAANDSADEDSDCIEMLSSELDAIQSTMRRL